MKLLSFRKTVWISFGILILGYSISTVFGFYIGLDAEKRLRIANNSLFPTTVLSNNASIAFEKQVKLYKDAVFVGEIAVFDETQKLSDEVISNLLKMSQLPYFPKEMKSDVENQIHQMSAFTTLAQNVYLKMSEEKEVDEQIVENLSKQTQKIEARLLYYNSLSTKTLKSELNTLGNNSKRQRIINIILFAIVVFAATFFAWFIISRAITQLKKSEIEKEEIEKKLRQAYKLEAIGTLAGGIAHDFNNILTSIIGFTQLAMGKPNDEDRTKARLEKILKAGLRARELVAHILTFSRQSESEDFQYVGIAPIIKETIKLLKAALPANIELGYENTSISSLVYTNPVEIHRIIMNLCTNASHAIGSTDGLIKISLVQKVLGSKDFPELSDFKPGEYLEICVSDTGHGMDQITLSKVFDPYFTTKGKGEGTGLGLSVVHGIVKKHSGHITAFSEPGKGTSFYVYLPLADKRTENKKKSNQQIQSGSERILVLDNEETITEVLAELLELMGYKVDTFTNPKDALESFRADNKRFDLILTDLTMPHMSGEDLALKIREIDTLIPIIIQTGFSENLDTDRLKKIGINSVLKKPLLKKELSQAIRKALDESIQNQEFRR